MARHDDRHQITGIKCRVCGEKLEGEVAREEHARMLNEHAANLENVSSGRLPRYAADPTFVLKTFPALERMSPDDFCARVDRSKAAPSAHNKMDRNRFPKGSPGYFVCQATTLTASVEDIPHLFFQLVSRRYERGSILITSNRSVGEWGDVFGDAVVATAILDRLLRHSHVLTITGESYRLREKRRAGVLGASASSLAKAVS